MTIPVLTSYNCVMTLMTWQGKSFGRIWVHVTKCLLWKNSLFGRFLAKSIFSIHFDLLDDIKSLCLLWKQKHLDFVLFFFGEIFLVWNGHIWVPKLRLVSSRLKQFMKMDATRCIFGPLSKNLSYRTFCFPKMAKTHLR